MSDPIHHIEKLVGEGRFLEARSKTEKMLLDSDDLRLKQLLALSMAKSGAPKAAMDFLEPIYREHPEDPESAGILGSIYKELFKETKTTKYAVLSRDTYLKNFQQTGNHYTGINAASMSAISGSVSKGREVARQLINNISANTTDAWELATLGEAHLLLREKERSVEYYGKCRHALGSDWGKVNSIHNQLWLLNHYIPVFEQVMNIFSPPAVAVFVGHMIDHPSRGLSRFPEPVEAQVKEAITSAIKTIHAKIGYCSVACGGDIIFAEAMVETGAELNLFLPFQIDDFLDVSVKFAGLPWVDRFNKLISEHPVKFITREPYSGSDELFTFQSKVMFGEAMQRGNMMHISPYLISLFSNVDAKIKEGGTRDSLKLWPLPDKRININPEHFINVAVIKATKLNSDTISPATNQKFQGDLNRHIRYLLYIRLQDATTEDGERFNYHLTKKIKEISNAEIQRGDQSILFAFKTPEEAAGVAWSVLRLLRNFVPSSKVRVTLHAGPVYVDEVTSSLSGPQTEIVKSIQEFVISGKVYASFQFATVLAIDSKDYAMEYAGLVSIHENEKLEIYQLNRHAEAFDL
ncbi:MAG: TRAFs-binding domain-containing protein [Cyclobacteriaceae bacterium]